MADLDDDAPLPEVVPLRSVFSEDCVVAIDHGSSKRWVVQRLVEVLAAAGKLPPEEVAAVVDALIDRETMGTTGLGKGLAIPHARTAAVAHSAGAIGIAPEGVDFESLDGLPTRLIFLLLSPLEPRREHGEILKRIARLLCDRTLQHRVQIPRAAEDLFSFLGF